MIIGLGQQSRVGKDTCGGFIASILRIKGLKDIKLCSFATPIKAITYDLFGHIEGVEPGEYFEDNPTERYKMIPALGMGIVDLWIGVGTKMRELYPKVWAEALIYEHAMGETVIIRDVRALNEVEAIRDEGGVVIKVTRDGCPVMGFDQAIPEDFEWDFYIENNGTKKELFKKCQELVEKIYG